MQYQVDPEIANRIALRVGALLSDGDVQIVLASFPVFLGLLVCFDAYSRGMNGLVWLFGIVSTLGLLFPLYLLHAWNPPEPPEQEHPHLPEFRNSWRIRAKYHCPYCTRGVIEGAVFCNRCGGRVDGMLREPYFRDPHPGPAS